MNSRFPVLSFLSGLLRFIGLLIIGVTIVGGILVVNGELGQEINVYVVIGGFINGLLGLSLIAYGELIGVAFAIEQNTRGTADYVGELRLGKAEGDESGSGSSDEPRPAPAPLEQGPTECPSCAAPVQRGNLYCSECGARAVAISPEARSQ